MSNALCSKSILTLFDKKKSNLSPADQIAFAMTAAKEFRDIHQYGCGGSGKKGKMSRCVEDLKDQGKSDESAGAICATSVKGYEQDNCVSSLIASGLNRDEAQKICSQSKKTQARKMDAEPYISSWEETHGFMTDDKHKPDTTNQEDEEEMENLRRKEKKEKDDDEDDGLIQGEKKTGAVMFAPTDAGKHDQPRKGLFGQTSRPPSHSTLGVAGDDGKLRGDDDDDDDDEDGYGGFTKGEKGKRTFMKRDDEDGTVGDQKEAGERLSNKMYPDETMGAMGSPYTGRPKTPKQAWHQSGFSTDDGKMKDDDDEDGKLQHYENLLKLEEEARQIQKYGDLTNTKESPLTEESWGRKGNEVIHSEKLRKKEDEDDGKFKKKDDDEDEDEDEDEEEDGVLESSTHKTSSSRYEIPFKPAGAKKAPKAGSGGRFKACQSSGKSAALCAFIGRKKFGAKKMGKMAAHGKV